MRHLTRCVGAMITVVFAVAIVQPVAASDSALEHHSGPPEHLSVQGQLGVVNFANSGAPRAQPAFQRGLLLLHSFEYPAARREFQQAEELDPSFAMMTSRSMSPRSTAHTRSITSPIVCSSL